MGRKPLFKPVLKGGSYHVYVPGQGFVDLGTTDAIEAETKAMGHASQHAKASTVPKQVPVKTQTQTPSSEALRAWISSGSSNSSSSNSQPSSPSQRQSPSGSLSGAQSPVSSEQSPNVPSTSLSVENRVAQLMPEEKRKKLADLCSRLASRVTILLTGATVRVFGRIPDPEVDKEEKEVLQEGLSMMLDEAFVEHPPKPWMVVAGATVGIGIGMYVNGTPVQKRQVAPPQRPSIDDDIPITEESSA